MENKFVVLSLQRSGSTYLISSLNNHPNIECSGEIFKRNNPLRIILPEHSYSHSENESIKSRLMHFFNRSKLTSLHMSKIYNSQNDKVIGFKLMPRQIRKFPESIRYILKNKVKILFLYRSNYFNRFVSIQRAAKTGVYGSKKAVEDTIRFKIDTKLLIGNLNKIEEETNKMLSLAKQAEHMAIQYEDFFGKANQQIGKEICAFLQVEDLPLQSPLKKIINNSLSEIIINYDEVEETLKNSKYKHFLPA